MSTSTAAAPTTTQIIADFDRLLLEGGWMTHPEYQRRITLAKSRAEKARKLEAILLPVVRDLTDVNTDAANRVANRINKRICRAYRAAALSYRAVEDFRLAYVASLS